MRGFVEVQERERERGEGEEALSPRFLFDSCNESKFGAINQPPRDGSPFNAQAALQRTLKDLTSIKTRILLAVVALMIH